MCPSWLEGSLAPDHSLAHDLTCARERVWHLESLFLVQMSKLTSPIRFARMQLNYGVAFVSKIKIDLLGKTIGKSIGKCIVSWTICKFQSKLQRQQIDLQKCKSKLQSQQIDLKMRSAKCKLKTTESEKLICRRWIAKSSNLRTACLTFEPNTLLIQCQRCNSVK